jgi:hypothetical protein
VYRGLPGIEIWVNFNSISFLPFSQPEHLYVIYANL